MPTNKRKELRVTKFYLLAWVFGLLCLWCVYKTWWLAAGITFMLFIAYSRADYIHPPSEGGKGPNNDDHNGLAI